MGLEDFMSSSDDADEDDSTDEQSRLDTTSSSSSQTEDLGNNDWSRTSNGKLKPRNFWGHDSEEAFKDTVVEDVDAEQSLFKHKSIIFTRIDDAEPRELGKRYKVNQAHMACSCLVSERRKMSNINREAIMLDTGCADKSEAFDVLEERMGFRPEASDKVTFTVFMQTRHAMKAALAEQDIGDLGAHGKEAIIRALYSETDAYHFGGRKASELGIRKDDEVEPW